MMNLKGEKGVTFIEFITVILILIILAGISGAKYIDLEPFMAMHYTDKCANNDGTDLAYNNTTGRVACPNHP